jgi:hypothetical protein
MKLNEISTYNELSDYLLERMDYADSSQSRANTSFSKEKMWNMYIGDCLKWKGENLPIRTRRTMLKRIKKDFGQSV